MFKILQYFDLMILESFRNAQNVKNKPKNNKIFSQC